MKAIVTIDKVYTNGSGAPAVVVCRGFYFAADFIGGEARLSTLTGRAPSRRVIAEALQAYTNTLNSRVEVDADWYERNRAMYPRRLGN